MNDQVYPKPVNFDQLYAGRFLKAGELLGKKVTITISDYDREALTGDDGTAKPKAILSFKETDRQHVCCRTNGLCIKAMFGPVLAEWVGKRITIFEGNWNGEPCIRVWGSPDIPKDMDVTISLPRRRPFIMTMHARPKTEAV
ncbi:MAG: hypothetical protein ACRDIC_19730 [bacterium]